MEKEKTKASELNGYGNGISWIWLASSVGYIQGTFQLSQFSGNSQVNLK